MDRETVKEHNIKMAKFLCDRNGCDEKKRKIHFEQIVRKAWNPHPSQEFIQWWHTQPESRIDNVQPTPARNCKVFVNRYKEAVEIGIANLPTDYPA